MNSAERAEDVLRELGEELYRLPLRSCKVSFEYIDGAKNEIAVYVGPKPGGVETGETDDAETEAMIMSFLPNFEDQGILTSALRKKCGYENKSHFNKILAGMRDKGMIHSEIDGREHRHRKTRPAR